MECTEDEADVLFAGDDSVINSQMSRLAWCTRKYTGLGSRQGGCRSLLIDLVKLYEPFSRSSGMHESLSVPS